MPSYIRRKDDGSKELYVFSDEVDASQEINQFAGSNSGSVPTSTGGTSTFLRADGQWAAPSVGGVGWGAISGTLSDQTDLQSALNGKSASGHNHDASYEALGAVATHAGAADPHTGYQRESEKDANSGYAGLDGSGNIGSDRVATASIEAGAVTYAKLQDVSAASRLIGRGSAGGAGDPEEVVLGTNLSMSGTTLNATGGVSQLIVCMVADSTLTAWSNMPAAVTFFANSHKFTNKLDLTNYTQCRLVVHKATTAGAASSIVRLRYRTAFDTTVGNWLQIGTSSVEVAVNTTNAMLVTSWIDLAAGAKADVFITLDGSGGDGVLDPAFGNIYAQFK